jgi:hypothetical protein
MDEAEGKRRPRVHMVHMVFEPSLGTWCWWEKNEKYIEASIRLSPSPN